MKVVSAKEAVKYIKSGVTVGVSGSGGTGSPEAILKEILARFKKEGEPKNLTVTAGISPGNLTDEDVGMNCLAEKGLVKKAYCAHLGMGKKFGRAIGENQFAAFGLPLGVYTHLLCASASKQPAIITHVGLNTFVDPRFEGACENEKAKKDKPIVKLINFEGEEKLMFKTFPIDVAIIKASYADTKGNISLEWEGILGEQFPLAAAAHNNGGIVIVQVEKVVPYGTLPAKDVLIPACLVDFVVEAKPDLNLGDYNTPKHIPALVGKKRIKLDTLPEIELNERKVCARRAMMELNKNELVNLGVGMPELVASVCNEEGNIDDITMSIETGITGGVAQHGIAFGVSYNADSIIGDYSMFDLYDGGVLDAAVLGLAEVDKFGNVNVSKFGKRVTGPGGFIDITQNTKKIIFVGTFTSGEFDIKVNNGKLNIVKDGKIKKFVNNVQQITFSAKNAIKNKQDITYVTERAVFKLTNKGLKLIEIAPNVDLKKDILKNMSFKPIIAKDIKIMNTKIFKKAKMNIKLK